LSSDFVGEFMRLFIATAAALAAITGYPALAEETAQKETTRIEVDQKAKAFIFIIDGKPAALLDENGLHVRRAIVYGETLTDAGTQSFDKRMQDLGKEAADE
jgi:hypothetical protein